MPALRSAVVVFCRSADRDTARFGSGDLAAAAHRALTARIAGRVGKLAGEVVAGRPVDVLVFHEGEVDREAFARAGSVTGFLRQRGRTFGERLTNAFGRTFARGYEQVVVVGTDIPGLRAQHLREALVRLSAAGDSESRVVLGPDTRGGCYLIGLRRGCEGVLAGVEWQRNSDCGEILRACGPAVALLSDRLHDLDGLEDIQVVRGDMDWGSPLGRLLSQLVAGLDDVARPVASPDGDAQAAKGLNASIPRSSRGPPAWTWHLDSSRVTARCCC